MNEEEIRQLKNQFKLLDKDNSGNISFDELQKALDGSNFKTNHDQWDNIMKNLRSENNYINYTEFLAATIDKR